MQRGGEHPFGYHALPRFTITNYGAKCHFPIIEVHGFTVAVLLCEKRGEHLGLLLHKSRNPFQDPSRPLYFVSDSLHRNDGSRERVRMLSLGKDIENLRLHGEIVAAEWRTIYIAQSATNTLASSPSPNTLSTIQLRSPVATMAFHLPQWLLARLSALGFHSSYTRVDSSNSTTRVRFHNWERGEHIYAGMGTCHGPNSATRCWARVVIAHVDSCEHVPQADVHDCGEHHIDAWDPVRSKLFGDDQRAIRISFLPSKLDPAGTLLVHLELHGTVFEEMLARGKVSIPSAEALQGHEVPAPPQVMSQFSVQPSPPPALRGISTSHLENGDQNRLEIGGFVVEAVQDARPDTEDHGRICRRRTHGLALSIQDMLC